MEEVTTKAIQGMTDAQITSVSSALTDTVTGVVDTFVKLVPIIALTTGAIFAIKFVKGRFNKIEKVR